LKETYRIDCGKFGQLVVEGNEKGLTMVTLEGDGRIKDLEGISKTSTLGEAGIRIRRISACELLDIAKAAAKPQMPLRLSAKVLCEKAGNLIAGFLSGDKQAWEKISELPIDPDALGDRFVGRVLQLLRHVPCGCYITYGDMAEAAGNSKGPRAVGMAMSMNPLLIVVPCHRVYGKLGNFNGFGGGLGLKASLSKLEQ
jgi:O-6-methylguanine DNA methyltransferase